MNKNITLTKKGQVTIPAAFRKRHGLDAQDKVFLEDKGDHIELRPMKKEEFFKLYKSVSSSDKPMDAKQMRKKAQKEVAKEASKEGL